MRNIKGFYTDEKGKRRPITERREGIRIKRGQNLPPVPPELFAKRYKIVDLIKDINYQRLSEWDSYYFARDHLWVVDRERRMEYALNEANFYDCILSQLVKLNQKTISLRKYKPIIVGCRRKYKEKR